MWVTGVAGHVPHEYPELVCAGGFLCPLTRVFKVGVPAAVAERLSEPRWLRFTPPGFDAGESGQFRAVRARALKARAETPFPEALTSEQVDTVLACCHRPREHFMVVLLLHTGLRIGEAL